MTLFDFFVDADDFDPDAGFSKAPEDGEDTWEGEDEGLVIEEDKEVKQKRKTSAVVEKKLPFNNNPLSPLFMG